MGMSASQARYLQLTARKNDVEYQAQQICQQRLSLAERTEMIAKKYTQKINDRHLYYDAPYTLENAVGEDGELKTVIAFDYDSRTVKRLDYYDLTNDYTDKTQPGLGMRIVDADGKIVVPAIPEGEDPANYHIDPSIVPNMNDGENAYRNACDYLENKLRTAEWTVQAYSSKTESGWIDSDIYTNKNIKDKLYTDNDSAAEAEYTAESETIQHQDKILSMRLQQLTTEQNALNTELDSVKKVIEKNVEGTFKTFG